MEDILNGSPHAEPFMVSGLPLDWGIMMTFVLTKSWLTHLATMQVKSVAK